MTFGNATKTIGGIFMNDNGNQDEMGIRHTGGSNLRYNTNGATFGWFGSGIMDKPISDFFDFSDPLSIHRPGHVSLNAPFFSDRGGVTVAFKNHLIPEPAEYALVFGLFALAFVIVRRRFQKKTKKGSGDYGI